MNKFSLALALALILSFPFSALAQDMGGIDTLETHTPAVSAPASVDLHCALEYQAGIGYDRPREFALTVNEGETSIIEVNYKREPLISEYRITGSPAVDRNGRPAWNLHVVRQDQIDGRDVAAPQVADLMLNPGERISLTSKGSYRGLPRNLRLTLNY